MSSDYQLEDTVYLPFTTRQFSDGVPTALVSGVIDIYEDVTATPIITGETLTVSLNSVAGFNVITVTATAATGFGAGQSYTAVVQAGTVDGTSIVGEVVAHFTLDKNAAAKDLANGTDGLGALKALIDTVNTDLSNGTDGLSALKAGIDAIPTVMVGTDGANTTTPPTAAAIVDEWETQSQADPTGFHVNVQEWLDVVPSALISGRVDAEVASRYKKNTATANIMFLMLDDADHVTPETGHTVSGTRSIDGGAFGAVTGTIGEVANGLYQIDTSAADMNGDDIVFRFTAAGADDTFLTIRTSA